MTLNDANISKYCTFIHPSPVASTVSLISGAINQILFTERDQIAGHASMLSLEGPSGRKCPAGAAMFLVFHLEVTKTSPNSYLLLINWSTIGISYRCDVTVRSPVNGLWNSDVERGQKRYPFRNSCATPIALISIHGSPELFQWNITWKLFSFWTKVPGYEATVCVSRKPSLITHQNDSSPS